MGDTAPRTRFTARISFGVWHPIARRAAREIYGIYGKHRKHVTLHTYPYHDGDPAGAMANGTSFSVDFYIAPFNHRPSAAQKAVGQKMVNYACRNWNRLNLDKIIWNHYYTRDGRNWYRYKWWTFRYNWGSAKLPDKNHTNHPHMRFGNWR